MTLENNKEAFLETLEDILGDYGFSPFVALAIRFFLRNPYESLVITDKHGKLQFMDRGSEKLFDFPPGSCKGEDIIEFIPDSGLPGVLETGYPSVGRVLNVQGFRKLSSVYPLIKDGELVGALGRVLFHSLEEVERLHRKLELLENKVKASSERQRNHNPAHYTFDSILGKSDAMREAVDLAKRVASVEADALIVGESGVGKELFAQAIHNAAAPSKPFIRVNCAAIPFELAESELFGYESGAFSGASSRGKPGKFELAQNGSIFLDEISALPLSTQAKLLRVLQERELEKLGGSMTKKINLRVLAASNEDLVKATKERRFREDLYYRLAKAIIRVPPLRERKEDIPVYVEHYLKLINRRFRTGFERLSDKAAACFMNYSWPGNVRNLINALEQAILKKWTGTVIPRHCLAQDIASAEAPKPPDDQVFSLRPKRVSEEMEKTLIQETLSSTNGNKRKAALLLGMSRTTLYTKLKKYDLVGV